MKLDICLSNFKSWSIGLSSFEGEDSDGEFVMLSLGLLVISIDLFVYQ